MANMPFFSVIHRRKRAGASASRGPDAVGRVATLGMFFIRAFTNASAASSESASLPPSTVATGTGVAGLGDY